MTVLEKIIRCVSLVWDFQEIYSEEDIEDFCRNELCMYSQYDEIQAYLAGLEAGKDMNVPIKWHKVADGDLPKGENIHRDIYLKDRYGNLYTGNYFPKDKCHAEDCFAVEFLDWGFQGSQFCKKEQISEWCEK